MTPLYIPPFLMSGRRRRPELPRLAAVCAAVYGGLWLAHAGLRILFP